MFTSSNSTFPMNCNHRKPPPDPWALYVLAAVGALCFAVVLSMLTGCTTTRTVERVTVHRDTVWRSRVDTVRAASHHADTRNEKKTTHSGFLWPPLSLIVFLAVFGLIGYALKR